MTLRLTGGAALVRALRPENIGCVFGIAGGKIAPLLRAFAEEPGVRYLGVRHEASGAIMAAAIYAATGRMAVTFAELGPGTGNIVAGVSSAYNNRTPLLLITSNNQHAKSYPFTGMFMELDNFALLRPVTKWNAVVHDGLRIPELVRWAFREALTGRRGPVHLDVPQDVLLQTFEFRDDDFDWQPEQYRVTMPVPPHPAQLAAAAALLAGAERPLLIAGGGAADASAALRTLAKMLNAPVVATQTGIGAVASDDPLCVGQGGILGGPATLHACRNADVVLAVGCRFSSWMWDGEGPLVGRHQRLIHIDTDPGVIGSQVPAAIGMVACATLALPALVDALGPLLAGPPPRAWIDDLRAQHAAHRARLAAMAAERTEPMHPAALAAEIGRCLPPDALVAYDGGHTTFWSYDFTPVAEPRTRFNDAGMAQLGAGLPVALALQVAFPERRVVNITADGAFGFTLPELDTARRHGLPVISIIHNNAAWGVIAFGQQRAGFDLGTDLAGTDYAAIARGFGCHGEVVTTPEHFLPALTRALACNLPAVLDCRTSFVPHPMLPTFGQMGQVGIAAGPAMAQVPPG